jgi:hypothetical protein
MLDKYIQDLADLPQIKDDPYDILWPVLQRIAISNTQEIEDVAETILNHYQPISKIIKG